MRGCTMPASARERESASIDSRSKRFRGCAGFGWMRAVGISRKAGSPTPDSGRIAARPRPMPLRSLIYLYLNFWLSVVRDGCPPTALAAGELGSELGVCVRAARRGGVLEDRNAEGGSFGDSHAAGYHGVEDQ